MSLPWSCRRRRSDIGLWIASTGADGEPLPLDWICLLSKSEREQLGRFRVESDRRRYLVARVLLRAALSHATSGHVDPRCWRYGATEHGKPVVAAAAGLPALEFSLSHCRRLAVVAVASGSPVGVDAESLDPANDADLAGAVLAPGERDWLRHRSRTTRGLDLVRLWTLKEAYAKLLGRGVVLDFASFEMAMDPPRLTRTETGEPAPSDLHLATQEIRMPDGLYQLSLAAKRRGPNPPQVTFHLFHEALLGLERDCSRRAG